MRVKRLIYSSLHFNYYLDYIYSPSGVYYCPKLKTLEEYKNFVETFPIIDEPEIFGMHENANITYQVKI